MSEQQAECDYCRRAGSPTGINILDIPMPDRNLRAEGTIRPDGNGGHEFDGLTIDDPANRDAITLALDVPHPLPAGPRR